jgi:hypothetical protein
VSGGTNCAGVGAARPEETKYKVVPVPLEMEKAFSGEKPLVYLSNFDKLLKYTNYGTRSRMAPGFLARPYRR